MEKIIFEPEILCSSKLSIRQKNRIQGFLHLLFLLLPPNRISKYSQYVFIIVQISSGNTEKYFVLRQRVFVKMGKCRLQEGRILIKNINPESGKGNQGCGGGRLTGRELCSTFAQSVAREARGAEEDGLQAESFAAHLSILVLLL